MSHRRVGLLALAVPLLAASACAKPSELVILVPHPETGAVGAATVSAGDTTVDLARSGEGTRIRKGEKPTAPAPIPPEEIERIFGSALGARPPAPVQFLLYFENDREQLVPESQPLVAEILAEIQRRLSPEVTIIGHTDRTADDLYNIALGLRRATHVRDLLLAGGVDPALVEVASHGEADPLVPTADGVAEPRNRRAEVTIR